MELSEAVSLFVKFFRNYSESYRTHWNLEQRSDGRRTTCLYRIKRFCPEHKLYQAVQDYGKQKRA